MRARPWKYGRARRGGRTSRLWSGRRTVAFRPSSPLPRIGFGGYFAGTGSAARTRDFHAGYFRRNLFMVLSRPARVSAYLS